RRYAFLCSKKRTGSLSLMAEISSPFASAGVDGMTTLRPGVEVNTVSIDCEWERAPWIPPPNGERITIGQFQSPFERYRIFAASFRIWFVAGRIYSANWISATGRFPIMAA